ncbi:hypothetical protein [Prosthecobacter sp.]|uniref:hypothetical protein n=1 Tax=Prosthecobacter sp. TaxID=1965333 RepID=UPI0024897E39|nr:hypothetical protein [Prosthecobacter sp.]MDI1311859.1 hypothetical protein [Prosthecobacter sp.]
MKRHIRPAEIVGHDENNVRFRGGCMQQRAAGEEQEKKAVHLTPNEAAPADLA